MALNPHLSAASRKLALDAAFDVLNGGFLKVYDGTQPASPETAITTQVLLVSHSLNATAFGAAAGSGGATCTKTANAITNATIATGGTPTWATLVKSDNTTRVQDFSCGTSGIDMTYNAVPLVAGATSSVTSLVESMAA